MGFRLIRENSDEYRSKFDQLKKQQLLEHTQIWTNLVHNKEKVDTFLARFMQVMQRRRGGAANTMTAKSVENYIKTSKANLVTLQGNVNLADLYEILDLHLHD